MSRLPLASWLATVRTRDSQGVVGWKYPIHLLNLALDPATGPDVAAPVRYWYNPTVYIPLTGC